MSDVVFHQSTTYPILDYTLVSDDDDTAHPLDGATITFYMWRDVGGKPGNFAKINGAACSIVSATLGQVRYSPTAADTDTLGDWLAIFKVAFSNGKIRAFPEEGYLKIGVIPFP